LSTGCESCYYAKKEIVTIINPAQREYNTPKDIEIITPPSRTERLDGFRPLKEE